MSLRIVTGVVVLGLVRGAAADRAIVVDANGAPFAPADLARAIRVRVPLAGPPLHVRVTAIAGGVRVAAPAGARDVELDDRTGADAARLVALAANDLLTAEPLLVDAAPAGVVRRDGTAVSVLASAADWNGLLGGLAVELASPHGGWVVAADLGGGSLFDGPIQLADLDARVGIGRRAGPIEVRVEAVAEPLFVTTGTGDFTALVGASASVRARIPIGAARAVIAAGGDAFATQAEYRLAGVEALTTPRLAPWLRVGVEVPL